MEPKFIPSLDDSDEERAKRARIRPYLGGWGGVGWAFEAGGEVGQTALSHSLKRRTRNYGEALSPASSGCPRAGDPGIRGGGPTGSQAKREGADLFAGSLPFFRALAG